MSVILRKNGVRTRCAATVNHPAVLKILRVVNLLRVVFLVRRGPLGSDTKSYTRAVAELRACGPATAPKPKGPSRTKTLRQ